MADYYSILGVSKNATPTEIKSAFRKLAKQLHPDKNPNQANARELFNTVVKAYETLSDPVKKRRYDLLHYANENKHHAASSVMQRQQRRSRKYKEWDFSDEELKKRQYYQQYYKQKQESVKPETVSSGYSDYKYILYAAPIAVGLLMFMLSVFNRDPETENLLPPPEPLSEIKTIGHQSKIPLTGEQVYQGYFGPIKTFSTKYHIKVENITGYSSVVAIYNYNTDQYIQHAFVNDGDLLEFNFLPQEGVYLKCLIGRQWDDTLLVNDKHVIGNFDSIVQYQNWKKSPIMFDERGVTELLLLNLVPDKNKKSLVAISNEADFFTKH